MSKESGYKTMWVPVGMELSELYDWVRQRYTIQLFGEDVPEFFRSIKLGQPELANWRSKGLDKEFLKIS